MSCGKARVCTKAQWLQWAGKYVLSLALIEMQPIPVAARSHRGLGGLWKVNYPLPGSIHVITDACSCSHWWRVEGTVNPHNLNNSSCQGQEGCWQAGLERFILDCYQHPRCDWGFCSGSGKMAWALPPRSSSDPSWTDRLLGFHGSLRHAQISTQALKI